MFVAYYANRNGALVDTDGKQVGTCNVDTSDTFDCTDDTASKWNGFSQLFCKTDIAAPSY